MVVGMIMTVVMTVRVSVVMAMVVSTRLSWRVVVATVVGGARPGLFFHDRMCARSEILNRFGREDIDIGQRPQSRRLQKFRRGIALGGRTRKLHKGVSCLPCKTVGRKKLRDAQQ